MGLCGSTASGKHDLKSLEKSQEASIQTDKKLQESFASDRRVRKLLLLGAGESGKSTLFKQMISIYGKGWSDEDRRDYISIIHKNVLAAIQTLCQMSQILEKEGLDTRVEGDAQDSWDYIMERKENEPITEEMAHHVSILWKDRGIQTTYANRSRYHLPDSSNYFFDKVEELCEENYIPTEQDVLRSRVRTTGIVENEFIVDGSVFKMYDVGGQRNERKKWIHCFSEVTAVLFVAALSCYDMVLFEDKSTNRMDEALTLFSEITNSRWFKSSSIVLLLNKRDLFSEKIKKVPLTVCFPEYEGDNTYDAGIEFLKEQFVQRVRDPNKQVFTHVCCATDKDNMRVVFNAIKETIIRMNLQEGGLA